jgi:succinoglycan biosynthesis transport protein ExoP
LIILLSLLLALPLGALYLFTTPASYTASATMMIETRKSPLQETFLGNPPLDSAWIESQIGVVKSQGVAAYVVKQLRLAEDPGFIRPAPDLVDRLLDRLGWGSPEPKTEAERVGAAVAAVMGGLAVRRIGQSYMLRIDFSSHDREQAVKVANAMIDGYIFDQLNAKYQANRRAGDWLQERLQALREQASAAERAVVEFKAKNNIVSTGGNRLMNESELADLSGQLAKARAHTGDVQVRLERIEAVRRAYQQDKPASTADETVSEAMSNGIITQLRTKYLELVNREADWSIRYGKNHNAVVTLRNQIRDIRKSIHDELGRIEETYKSEYEIAKKGQDELEKRLAALISQSTETNQAQVALFSLEAAAQSYRKIYDSFLKQHTESVQQQSFPISDARSISPALVIKTGPKAVVVSIVTVLAGAMLGVGLGALREIRDRGFRTREHVRSVLATECLALVPLVADRKRFFSGSQSLALPARKAPLAIGTGMAPRSIFSAPRVMRTIVDAPSSPYAEAIRSIKLTVDLNSQSNDTKIIGLTSCLPSEGKSSVAAATATLIAQGGARVILVDCDLRHPSLSRALAPDASAGFLDVVAGKLPLADAVWTDPNTGMSFLPAGTDPAVPNAPEILASDAAKAFFSTLQLNYDYVIVDLAPIVAGVDVRAASQFVDSYVLVIEWGKTTIEAVQYALRHEPGIQANIVGAVLNKVNVAAMSRYDSYGAHYYYGQPRNPRSVN